jgi:hypothetical protein
MKNLRFGQFVLLIAWFFLLMNLFNPVDDSDIDYWNRSGMAVHTDNLTGCQYLATGLIFRSALMPRLDAEANHVGCND